MIKLILIDDSAFIRGIVRKMVASDPEIQVVGEATNGAEGLQKILELGPDVVCLDVVMPNEDGLSTLKKIITTYPTPVILFSSLSTSMSEVTKNAFDLGAFDVVQKPSSPDKFPLIGAELVRKIKAASKINRSKLGVMYSAMINVRESRSADTFSSKIIAIGGLGDNPALLEGLLSFLPKNLPAGIVAHQYVPQGTADAWLDKVQNTLAFKIKLADDGDLVAPGRILLSPLSKIIEVNRLAQGGVVQLIDQEARVKPCLDTMFCSVASAYGENAVAVALSGLSVDGLEGLRAVKRNGGRVFVQQDASLPAEVAGENLADGILPPEKIAEEITRLLIG